MRPSDPDYGPSVEWGWHGGFPRGLRIAGLVSVVFLIGLMYPHDGPANFVPVNTADNWLHLLLAIGMIGLGVLLGRRTTYGR